MKAKTPTYSQDRNSEEEKIGSRLYILKIACSSNYRVYSQVKIVNAKKLLFIKNNGQHGNINI